MSRSTPRDPSEIVLPGFHGRVVGQFAGLMAVEGEIDGELAPHSAGGDELAVVLRGRVEVDLAGKRFQLAAGDHLIIPAGAVHAVRSIGTARVLLIGAAE
jgi:quercetin dioxygenase-like cupin family protein